MQGDIDRRIRLLDAALAVAIGAAVLAAACAASRPDALDLLFVAVGTLALAGHRWAPRAVLAVTTVAMLGYVVHAHPGSWAAFPVLAAVHTAARGGRRAWGVAAGTLFLAGYFTVLIVAAPGAQDTVERTLLLLGWFLCAGVTGLIDKNWQAYLRQTEQRALDAERNREETALRRAGEERLRIARELHDSLTHSISIVKLQAGVAVHLARKRGSEVELPCSRFRRRAARRCGNCGRLWRYCAPMWWSRARGWTASTSWPSGPVPRASNSPSP